jgi:predicted nucleic acid-binding protein
MSREIFVDASAWIAVIDVRGKYHDPATRLFGQLVADKRPLLTTNLVIAESYVMIQRTSGIRASLRFLESIRVSPLLLKIYSDALLELQAENILRQYSDQDFSLADAVSFAVMRQLSIHEAFAFDHHFETVGFVRLPVMG